MAAAVPGRRRSPTALAASQPSRAARRFTENTLQVPRAYNCCQLPRPQLWGAWGTADSFLYSAAQAEENGVSTA